MFAMFSIKVFKAMWLPVSTAIIVWKLWHFNVTDIQLPDHSKKYGMWTADCGLDTMQSEGKTQAAD